MAENLDSNQEEFKQAVLVSSLKEVFTSVYKSGLPAFNIDVYDSQSNLLGLILIVTNKEPELLELTQTYSNNLLVDRNPNPDILEDVSKAFEEYKSKELSPEVDLTDDDATVIM